MTEQQLSEFIDFVLVYLGTQVKIPRKRGTFVEFRDGMINVSPIGRNCTQAERDEFAAYDKVHGVRQRMVKALRERFDGQLDLCYSIGGQISIDVFPKGWDKTYCLRHVQSAGFDAIHFFGDKTFPGGNDYEIFTDRRVVGHSVSGPDDTRAQLLQLFGADLAGTGPA